MTTYTPPPAVAAAARRALVLRASVPASQRCCTAVGLRRASQLANRQPVSLATIRRMVAYFDRHAVDAQGAGWGKDSKGWQAWLAWGGDPGRAWATTILEHEGTMAKRNPIEIQRLPLAETDDVTRLGNKNLADLIGREYNAGLIRDRHTPRYFEAIAEWRRRHGSNRPEDVIEGYKHPGAIRNGRKARSNPTIPLFEQDDNRQSFSTPARQRADVTDSAEQLLPAGEAPSHALDAILEHIRAGGSVYEVTHTKRNHIDKSTLERFERAGQWILKEDGTGYRWRTGKSSVWVSAGKYGNLMVSRRSNPFAQRNTARRNGPVLSGEVREGPDGVPSVKTFEKHGGKRVAKWVHVPAGVVDWRRDLAHPPRRLAQPVGLRDSPLVRHDGKLATSEAILPNGNVIPVVWQVVDLDQLVVSHDPFTLAANPAFPQDLQPRDRSRSSYNDQIGRLVSTFRPEAVMWSATASDGAPIIGQDGVVESGNGRTMALSRIYLTDKYPDKRAEYKQAVRAWAKELGVTMPKTERPVLVRVRVGNTDRAEFARLANVSTMQQMAAGELAVSDAAQMTAGLVSYLQAASSIGAGANGGFVDAFISQVAGRGARGQMISQDGKLSKEGETRIDLAIFAYAYGPESAHYVAELAEIRESDLKTVLQGMLTGAPAVAKVRAGIAQGDFYPNLDPAQGLIDLADLVRRSKEERTGIDGLLNMQPLKGMPAITTPLAVAWLPALRPKGVRLSARSLGDVIVAYCGLVADTPAHTDDFFAPPEPTPFELIEYATAKVAMRKEGPATAREVPQEALLNRRKRVANRHRRV